MNHFEKYLENLVWLHREIRLGRGDNEHADQIRDEMDEQHANMSEQQIADAGSFSELLYNLRDLGFTEDQIKLAADPTHSFLLSKTYDDKT